MQVIIGPWPLRPHLHYGSHWPMRTLLAARGFTFQTLGCGDICIDPAPPEQEK